MSEQTKDSCKTCKGAEIVDGHVIGMGQGWFTCPDCLKSKKLTSNDTEIKGVLSKILDIIIGLKTLNTWADGSYETKDLQIETLLSELQNHWVEIQYILDVGRSNEEDTKTIKRLVEALRIKDNWISVYERLPKQEDHSYTSAWVAATDGKEWTIARYNYEYGHWQNDHSPDDLGMGIIIFWMDIIPPKTKEKN